MAGTQTMSPALRISLTGRAVGGLSAALALGCSGHKTHVFEQASELKEVGAGIGISPNAVKVLRALGLEDGLRMRGFGAEGIVGRDTTTAQPLFHGALRGGEHARFGAAHVQVHRADLLDLLASAAG